jgi:hypothetical protein
MRRALLGLLGGVLLASCSQHYFWEKRLNETIGQTMAQVAAVHGPPASSYVLDPSHRTFQYLGFGTSPGIAAVMPGTGLIVSAPPQQTQCQLLLTAVAQVPTPTTLADWRVEGWSYNGVCPH